MNTLAERTGAHYLPLFTTFRCGKAIVELAKTIVPEYVAADSNPEGEVLNKSAQEMMDDVSKGGAAPGSMILSRTNAPLVPICLQLLKEGRKASVAGKDLGKSLIYMIKRSGSISVSQFLSWLAEWEGMECERAAKRNKPTEHITDRADCLRAFSEHTNDIDEMRSRIQAMFSDEENLSERVWCSTIHKAKGLEANTIWLLQDTCHPDKSEEEANVYYVGITRAISTLNMVSGKLR